MFTQTASDQGILRGGTAREGESLYLPHRWALMGDLMAIALTSIVSFQLAHHLLSRGLHPGAWHVWTDVFVAVVWFAALSVRYAASPTSAPTRGHEWRGVLTVTLQLFGFVLVFPMISRLDVLDLSHLAVEIPLGIVGVLGARSALRRIVGVDGPITGALVPGYLRARSISKVAFDKAFAAFAILMAAPVMILIAIAIKLTSAGPVFYISERIGLNGVPFRMVKFRSMLVGADVDTAAMIAASDTGPVFFKVKSDPRVTRVGRFIRQYSLDELPQFFNVLSGEMSVVGPRPQVQREVDAYDDVMRRRLLVKPGVTGQWQVSGRSDLSADESIRHDISYVDNWSMGLDIRIIAKTLGAVVRSDGAY